MLVFFLVWWFPVVMSWDEASREFCEKMRESGVDPWTGAHIEEEGEADSARVEFRPCSHGGFTVRRKSETGTNGARNIGLVTSSVKFKGFRHKPIDMDELIEIVEFMKNIKQSD